MRHQATEKLSVRQLQQGLNLRRNANFPNGVELCIHDVRRGVDDAFYSVGDARGVERHALTR
jgi:hypothetical protein